MNGEKNVTKKYNYRTKEPVEPILNYAPWSPGVMSTTFQAYAQEGKLIVYDIQLGGACNLNCVYCDTPDCRGKESKIDTADIERLIKEGNIEWLNICGLGEPTHPKNMQKLLELLEICKRNNVKVSMFTNLVNMPDVLFDYIKDGTLHVLFKLDSLDPKKEAELFGCSVEVAEERHENIKKLLECIRRSGNTTNVAASIVPTTVNRDELIKMFDFCIRNGIYPFMGQYEKAGKGKEAAKNLALAEEETKEIISKINEIYRTKYKPPICPATITGIHVDIDGNVIVEKTTFFSCPWFLLEYPEMIKICNIADTSHAEIERKINELRKTGEAAVKQLYENIEEMVLSGCGGDPCVLIEQFLTRAQFKPFKTVYTLGDIKRINESEYESYMQTVYNNISDYLKRNNLKVKYVAPILRDGELPGRTLQRKFEEEYSEELQTIDMKYRYEFMGSISTLKIGENQVNDLSLEENEVIVLADFNRSTGFTASMAVQELKKKNPNARIILATLMADYSFRDKVAGVEFATQAIFNNETQGLSTKECEELGIEPKAIYINYNQDPNEELACANFCPINKVEGANQIKVASRNNSLVLLNVMHFIEFLKGKRKKVFKFQKYPNFQKERGDE